MDKNNASKSSSPLLSSGEYRKRNKNKQKKLNIGELKKGPGILLKFKMIKT